MPITKIRKGPKVSASNVNVSPGQQLDDALTTIGAALDAKASAADVAAVTGNRSNLDTTDKTNLVAAINEVKGNIPTSYNELTDKPIVKTSDNGFVIVAQGANRANKATAQNAFAEGGNTEATGTSSHAEGYNTLAEGSGSHSEGQGTQAAGIASHSEGADTYASGPYSHAEGNGKVVIMLKQAYTQGDLTIVTDVPYPAYTELESPRTQERVSVVSVQESQGVYICTLAQAFSEDIATNQPLNVYGGAIGPNSHAEGCGTIAAHDSTHAEGYGTIANGVYAKASGEKSYALGRASETTGRGTQALNEAEHASGKYNKSTPNVTQFSVGIGADKEHRANAFEITTDGKMYVKGVGDYDGTNVSATGVKALGEAGWISISIDDIADVSKVSGNFSNSYAFGDATIDVTESPAINGAFAVNTGTVSGDYSFAEGNHTTASGTAAHAEGNDTEASGGASHAEGYKSEATADCAHAEGRMTQATANAAHAEGQFTSANGKQSHAEGSNSLAEADFSHAEGYYTQALGKCSHAEGWNTFTRNTGEHACGTYNKSTQDVTLFSIGNGYTGQHGAPDTHQNAFEVDLNGNVYIMGIGGYDGTNIGASGVKSVQQVIQDLTNALSGNNNNNS